MEGRPEEVMEEQHPLDADDQDSSQQVSQSSRKRQRDEDDDFETPDFSVGKEDDSRPPRKKHITRASAQTNNHEETEKSPIESLPSSSKNSKGIGKEVLKNEIEETDFQTASIAPTHPNSSGSALEEVLDFANAGNGRTRQAQLPKKIHVDESEIDMTWVDTLPAEIKFRSQIKKRDDIERRFRFEGNGTDRKEMGAVKPLLNRQGWAFKDRDNPLWTKAEFHYRLREQFILEDGIKNHPYDIEPEKGRHACDVTSCCTNQMHWTSDRDSVRDPEGRPLLIDGFKRNENTVKDPPDWVLDDGTTVIDTNGHAVKWFDGIPKTMSSQIEPWRVEGLRALNMMKVVDIVARMPRFTETADGRFELLQLPSAFTNRSINWRDENGLKSLKKGRPRAIIVISDAEDDASENKPKRKTPKRRTRKNIRNINKEYASDEEISIGALPSQDQSSPAPQQDVTPTPGQGDSRRRKRARDDDAEDNQPSIKRRTAGPVQDQKTEGNSRHAPTVSNNSYPALDFIQYYVPPPRRNAQSLHAPPFPAQTHGTSTFGNGYTAPPNGGNHLHSNGSNHYGNAYAETFNAPNNIQPPASHEHNNVFPTPGNDYLRDGNGTSVYTNGHAAQASFYPPEPSLHNAAKAPYYPPTNNPVVANGDVTYTSSDDANSSPPTKLSADPTAQIARPVHTTQNARMDESMWAYEQATEMLNQYESAVQWQEPDVQDAAPSGAHHLDQSQNTKGQFLDADGFQDETQQQSLEGQVPVSSSSRNLNQQHIIDGLAVDPSRSQQSNQEQATEGHVMGPSGTQNQDLNQPQVSSDENAGDLSLSRSKGEDLSASPHGTAGPTHRDMRYVLPDSLDEQLEIIYALGETVRYFRKYHPNAVEPLLWDMTYQEGLQLLRDENKRLFAAQGEDAMKLPGREAWYDVMAHWLIVPANLLER